MEYLIQATAIIDEVGENEIRRICSTAGGAINMEKIRKMIKYAETCINSYMHGRYLTPFNYNDVPKLIEFLAKELTIVYLYEAAYAKDKLPDAITILKEVQAGNLALGISNSPPPFIIMRKNEY